MKHIFSTTTRFVTLTLVFAVTLASAQSGKPGLVILDEISVANLGIEFEEADYHDFEETLFVIGRIENIPARKSVLSSRIQGRALAVHAFEGDIVEAGATLVEMESLQPGNPPPVIRLSAPQSGMVMNCYTHVGKPVLPETELFEIIDLTQVYAVAHIPEDRAGLLPLGASARIQVAALPGQTFEGVLARYGTTANAENGTVDAYFTIDNPDYKVRPNMRAEFSIVVNERRETLSLPRSALLDDGVNQVVFVSDFDLPNAFQKVPVQTGVQNETRVEILGGLFPGDQVVVRGAYPLLFAGGGGISLKEALDAAHGHEHNEDGSEMTAADRAAHAQRDTGNSPSGASSQRLLFLTLLSGFLFALLILSVVVQRRTARKTSENGK